MIGEGIAAKNLNKISAVALAGMALAGCEQPAGTNNEKGTEQSDAADGASSTDADQPANAIGIMQEPEAVVVPLLDPTVQPSRDDIRNRPNQPDDVLEQPAITADDTPR